ncbi:MAG: hypothetical protein U0797_30345 [Gemmataceae bacterium]
MTGEAEEFQVGGEPTADQVELYEWATKVNDNAPNAVQESLKQLVTLTTAFTAGSAALFNQIPLHYGAKVTVGASLLCSLVIAMYGWMPMWAPCDPAFPDQVRSVRDKLRSRKQSCLFASVGLLIFAMLVLMAASLFWPATPWPTP